MIGGGGMVGATAAHTLAMMGVAQDIALIDVAEELVAGQATDINHAVGYSSGVRVHVGAYNQIQEDDIVVITSGLPQKPGQTRLELLGVNAGIIRDVVGNVMAQGKPVFIVMVTNPVDVLTYVAWKASGLPKERVFGTGTMLDTSRLRVTLANRLGVLQSSVHGLVLGEHGDSSFVAMDNITIGGIPLTKFPGYDAKAMEGLEQEIREVVYSIIEAKKSTYFGISRVVSKVVEALSHADGTVLPVCSVVEGEYGLGSDLVLGLPSLVSTSGVKILDGYPLNAGELTKLAASAKIVREAIAGLQPAGI